MFVIRDVTEEREKKKRKKNQLEASSIALQEVGN
jgi:hypothetical protein